MRPGDPPDHPAVVSRRAAEQAAAIALQEQKEAESRAATEKARLEVWRGRATLIGRFVVAAYVMVQMGGADEFGERLTWIVVLLVLLGIVAAEKVVDRLLGKVGP